MGLSRFNVMNVGFVLIHLYLFVFMKCSFSVCILGLQDLILIYDLLVWEMK